MWRVSGQRLAKPAPGRIEVVGMDDEYLRNTSDEASVELYSIALGLGPSVMRAFGTVACERGRRGVAWRWVGGWGSGKCAPRASSGCR